MDSATDSTAAGPPTTETVTAADMPRWVQVDSRVYEGYSPYASETGVIMRAAGVAVCEGEFAPPPDATAALHLTFWQSGHAQVAAMALAEPDGSVDPGRERSAAGSLNTFHIAIRGVHEHKSARAIRETSSREAPAATLRERVGRRLLG